METNSDKVASVEQDVNDFNDFRVIFSKLRN